LLFCFQAILDTEQHSISYTLSRNQAVIVEYMPDEEKDMFQVRLIFTEFMMQHSVNVSNCFCGKVKHDSQIVNNQSYRTAGVGFHFWVCRWLKTWNSRRNAVTCIRRLQTNYALRKTHSVCRSHFETGGWAPRTVFEYGHVV